VYRWTVDDNVVASGAEAWVTAPQAGRHLCVLTVEANGETAERRVEFEALDIDA